MSHYYKNGEPVYELPCSTKEGMRAVTIRDVKKLQLDVGVTTLLSILDKPGLLRYHQQSIVKAVFSEEWQKENEEFDTYCARLIKQAGEHSKSSRVRGAELHQELENFFKSTTEFNCISNEISEYIAPVIGKIVNLHPILSSSGGMTNWIAEQSFSHPLGFGGKVDLYIPTTKVPNGIVVDFKTKATTDIKKFMAYEEHLLQLAAYREGLHLPFADCYDIYFSSEQPGIVKVHKWDEKELQKGWEMFKSLLNYWKVKNGIGEMYEQT